jgi:hypothetical protein
MEGNLTLAGTVDSVAYSDGLCVGHGFASVLAETGVVVGFEARHLDFG